MTTVPFMDPIHWALCVLVIPPGGEVYPLGPGVPKIGVQHGACLRLADLVLELDAFYCPLCQWNGRISGGWAMARIEEAG